MLRDVQTFVAAFDTLFGGFRARADQTYEILKDPQTAFVVVASPDADALREAAFFVERLGRGADAAGRPGAQPGHPRRCAGLSAQTALAAAERLNDDDPLTTALLRLHAERLGRINRERALRRRFAAAHPGCRRPPWRRWPTDVHDLDSLRQVGSLMAA